MPIKPTEPRRAGNYKSKGTVKAPKHITSGNQHSRGTVKAPKEVKARGGGRRETC